MIQIYYLTAHIGGEVTTWWNSPADGIELAGRSPKEVAREVFHDTANGYGILGAILRIEKSRYHGSSRRSSPRFYGWEEDGRGWGKVVAARGSDFYYGTILDRKRSFRSPKQGVVDPRNRNAPETPNTPKRREAK